MHGVPSGLSGGARRGGRADTLARPCPQALVPDAQLVEWAAGLEPQGGGVVARYAGAASVRAAGHSAGAAPSGSGRSGGGSCAAAAPDGLSELTLFSTNDYLGLGSHPDVCAAAAAAALSVGMGPRSSAVVGGTTTLHRELEEALADLKGTEDCLLFPTGFAANMAVVAALCASGGCDVFSDELNHASIVDGARLAMRGGGGGGSGGAGASAGPNRLHVYRHNDVAHLEELLLAATVAATDSAGSAQLTTASASSSVSRRHRRRLVVTDSLFSMDGDFAELRQLAQLRARHGFLLVVDEAHATLVCGETGAGAASAAGVSRCVDVHVGTLSKAAGALGGFVACSRDMKALLLNKWVCVSVCVCVRVRVRVCVCAGSSHASRDRVARGSRRKTV
jgi:8-amino-7-oxononanoate synthase